MRVVDRETVVVVRPRAAHRTMFVRDECAEIARLTT